MFPKVKFFCTECQPEIQVFPIMARFHAACIERPLRLCFHMMGHFIGSHPWWFLIGPLILSAGLGSGFFLLKDRISNDIQEQFTPVGGRAKAERRFIQETFPGNHSMFSRLRLSTDGSYATVIAASDGGVLTVESLRDVLDLDFKIRRMEVQSGNLSFRYVDVCAEVMGSCSSNDILEIIKYDADKINAVNLTFPWHFSDSRSFPLYLSLGGVKLHTGSSVVESAEAVQLHYYLDEHHRTKTHLWLESFIDLVSNASSASLQVSYSTSMSMQTEFEKLPAAVVPLFSVTYAVAITFSVASCWRLDSVRTKVWVASCGVTSAALAVLSGFGLLLLLNQPFVMTAASCPFLILGIGLDDMFIMLSCWRRTRVLDSVPDRLAHTYRDAAVSISVTTATDAAALLLGCGSAFGSVRCFCLYAALSVCFCFLYSVTLLGACMALDGHREAGNKHWLVCAKIPEERPPGGSAAFSACCVGGSYDRTTGKEPAEPLGHFFERFYGPFLTHNPVKAGVIVLYAGYLAASIYGCFNLKEGLDVRNLALDDSYIIDYYNNRAQHFSEYSYSVMVAVKQPFSYWDVDQKNHLHSCISQFEGLDFVSGVSAWFISFQRYADATNLDVSSQEAFQTHLPRFLEQNSMFQQDINLTADNQIQACRFFIHTLNKPPAEAMMEDLRRTADGCPVELLVYHPAFIYFDQYVVIVSTTLQTAAVAALVMLVVPLVLTRAPLCALCVAFAVFSVVAGVTGFMALWGINLDSVSMINLLMCVGFSVDFSAHVSYSFASSGRAVECRVVENRAVESRVVEGRAVENRAVEDRAVEGRAVENRAVESRAVESRAVEGRAVENRAVECRTLENRAVESRAVEGRAVENRAVEGRVVEALARSGCAVLQAALSTVLAVLVLSASGSYIFRTFFKIVLLEVTFGLLHSLVFLPVLLTVLLTLCGGCGTRCHTAGVYVVH